MKGIRGIIGHALINDALGQFETIAKKFEDGISHCNAEIDNHLKDIADKQQHVRDISQHVEKASRVLGKIKEFVS